MRVEVRGFQSDAADAGGEAFDGEELGRRAAGDGHGQVVVVGPLTGRHLVEANTIVVVAESVEYLVFGIETEYFAEQGVVLPGSIGIYDGERLRFGYAVELIGLSGFTLQHDTEIGGDGVGGLQLSLAVHDLIDDVGLEAAALMYLQVFVRRKEHLAFGRHLYADLLLEERIDLRGLLGPCPFGHGPVVEEPVVLFVAHRLPDTLPLLFGYY